MSERDLAQALKEKLDKSTGKAWEYYETVSGKYIVREDDGDDAGALAHFESADDAAFVCSAKNIILALLAQLEQAEREPKEHEFNTLSDGLKQVMEERDAAEAALRTLREASQKVVECACEECIAALAAALAAEGGK